jgi:hypothetical protein
MRLPWLFRARDDDDRPDPKTAEAHLRRVRAQRPEVNALVDALVRERRLNNFTANVVVTFRGGRQ